MTDPSDRFPTLSTDEAFMQHCDELYPEVTDVVEDDNRHFDLLYEITEDYTGFGYDIYTIIERAGSSVELMQLLRTLYFVTEDDTEFRDACIRIGFDMFANRVGGDPNIELYEYDELVDERAQIKDMTELMAEMTTNYMTRAAVAQQRFFAEDDEFRARTLETLSLTADKVGEGDGAKAYHALCALLTQEISPGVQTPFDWMIEELAAGRMKEAQLFIFMNTVPQSAVDHILTPARQYAESNGVSLFAGLQHLAANPDEYPEYKTLVMQAVTDDHIARITHFTEIMRLRNSLHPEFRDKEVLVYLLRQYTELLSYNVDIMEMSEFEQFEVLQRARELEDKIQRIHNGESPQHIEHQQQQRQKRLIVLEERAGQYVPAEGESPSLLVDIIDRFAGKYPEVTSLRSDTYRSVDFILDAALKDKAPGIPRIKGAKIALNGAEVQLHELKFEEAPIKVETALMRSTKIVFTKDSDGTVYLLDIVPKDRWQAFSDYHGLPGGNSGKARKKNKK